MNEYPINPGPGADKTQFPQPGGEIHGFKTTQEVGKQKDNERIRNEKKRDKQTLPIDAMLVITSESLAEQATPSPEEMERIRREKSRDSEPAPSEPAPAEEPQPKPEERKE